MSASCPPGFKVGQKVVVLGAYAHGADGNGVIVKPGKGREYCNKWWVDIDGTHIAVDSDKIVDPDTYYKK